MASPIYVETFIRAPLEAVWSETQEPARHRAWDLRFTEIEYLPKVAPHDPQRFLYATRVGFGWRIEGQGESVATREGPAGECTSVLRFWSDDPKSLIRDGGGYWRYLPERDGVRFLTLYSYRTRYGVAGAWFDRLVFRPMLGWATAWSFDCLRLALERGVAPRALCTQAFAAVSLRLAVSAVWIYQGLVPKLLFPDSGERAILHGTGLFPGHEPTVVAALGWLEILFGVALLAWPRSTGLVRGMAVILCGLLASAAIGQPAVLVAPFGPVALTIAMLGLAAGELWVHRDPLPSARHCRRVPPQNVRALP